MKVLLCNERFLFRFGVDRVLLLLAQGLKARGHTVYLMANRIDLNQLKTCADKVIEIPTSKGEYLQLNEFTASWLRDNLAVLFSPDEKPDIAIVAGWPFFDAIPLFQAYDIRVIYSDHGAVPLDGFKNGELVTQQKLRTLRKEFIPFSDRVIAVSNFIARSQSAFDHGDFNSVEVILNGADHLDDAFNRLEEREARRRLLANPLLRKGSGLRPILNLGRWERGNYKNSEMFLELIRAVTAHVPDVVGLVLAQRDKIELPSDLAEKIIPIGFPTDEELQEFMLGVEAGVSVSQWEGFNLPLAEMQWAGKPVFAFNVGAHAEVAVHSWFLAQDFHEMVEKLCAWLNDAGLSGAEHQTAIEQFRERFRWHSVIDRYEEVMRATSSAAEPGRFSDIEIFVEVTNSTRDPANSGVIRVTRSVCRALQDICSPVFVVWDQENEAYVMPTASEYRQLGAFNGPKQHGYHTVSAEGKRIHLTSLLEHAKQASARWLLLPETIYEENGKHVRTFARKNSLKIAAIFYDAIPILRPDLCKDAAILRNHANYMRGLAECDAIFPISTFSGKCLLEFWRNEKIQGARVLPLLLAGEFRAGPRLREPPLFNPNRVQIICVSTVEPRKNHRTLLDAMKILSSEHPELDWVLTLVGNRYAGGDELARMVEDACESDDRIRWLGIADDDVLRGLYESCSFTVYPSFIEGFGMPIVESLWHSKPCICYNEGVMSELASGGGCLAVDVLSARALSDGIYCLSTRPELYDRLAREACARSIKVWSEYAQALLLHLVGLEGNARNVAPQHKEATAALQVSAKCTQVQSPEQRRFVRSWRERLYAGCLVDDWQMNDSERLALMALLERHKPRCCIEVGTYKGGSLSLIAQYAESVFSIDIDASIPERFGYFNNVSFLTGSSGVVLPLLFKELDRQGIPVDLILIDGEHTAAGIQRDLELVFQYEPKSPLFLVAHDSFNQECRRGMREAKWHSAKYLRWVDLDFVPGRVVEHGGGGHGQLWGGMCFAYFEPGENPSRVEVGESARAMQACLEKFSSLS